MRCISLKTKRIKVLFYVLLAFFLIYVLVLNIKIHRINKKKSKHVNSDIRIPRSEQFNHSEYVELFYMQRKIWETSNLGSVLFKNVNPNNFLKNSKTTKTFTVLVWKYYNWLQNRHIHGFGFSRNDPLDHCEVKNCKFISNDTNISDVDVVLVHLQHGIIPKVKRRNAKQRWVFLTDESPKNVYSLAVNKPKISELSDVFNWSMSYRVESDVPVPYGRTVPLSRPANPEPSAGDIKSLIPNWKTKRRDTLLTILMSNCVSYRMDFLRDLQKYISIDVYGKCSENLKTKCPGHFKSECKSISNYLFYLVIENSICDQYLTEKAFYHAYAKGAIPIIIGPSIEECTTILPPKSFLHIDNFESMQHLANEIKTFAKDEAVLLSYHRWRNDFQVVNEHGYFDTRSYHYCRLCEALNYNDDKKKVYNEEMLRMYLEPKLYKASSQPNWYVIEDIKQLFTTTLVDTFLNDGDCEWNVLVLDWAEEASEGYLDLAPAVGYVVHAMPNVYRIGKELGEALKDLAKAGLHMSKMNLMGYSIGAHLMGIAAKVVKEAGNAVRRIIGCDPAGIIYDTPLALGPELDDTCADFVLAIHTDPKGMGTAKRSGHADVWVNHGPVKMIQPGCPKGNYPFFSTERHVATSILALMLTVHSASLKRDLDHRTRAIYRSKIDTL